MPKATTATKDEPKALGRPRKGKDKAVTRSFCLHPDKAEKLDALKRKSCLPLGAFLVSKLGL